MTRTVALLGATGFTGRLTAAELTRRGVEHRIGGRSADRLAAVPSQGDRHVVSLDDPASLDGFLDGADVLIGHVGDTSFQRFVALAVDLAQDDLGPAHLHLVALAAHRLDQHGQLQLAATGDIDHLGRVAVGQADRHIAQHFTLEPIAQVIYSDTIGESDVPNNDSTLVEFDTTNLFSIDRFPGEDRVETGLRANVGLTYTRYDPAGWSLGATDMITVKGFVGAAGFPLVIASIGVFEIWLSGHAIRRGWIA